MTTVELPGYSYDATSLRPGWPQLPAELRTEIGARLGAPVDAVAVAGGGFTPGFAAVIRAGHERAFLKAAPAESDVGSWYTREAQIVRALPTPVPTPRLRWVDKVAGHVVLCFDAVDGRMPALGWSTADLSAALAAQTAAARALADPPAALTKLVTGGLTDIDPFDHWRSIESGERVLPAFAAALAPRLAELARWEARIGEYSAAATGLMHCDLRLDNVLIDVDGQAWICDWSFLCRGPAWLDTALLLLSAIPGGHDVEALFWEHPSAEGVPVDALDVGLAAMAGFYVTSASRPEVDASPHLRRHQRFYLDLTVAWLSRRHGW